MAEKKVMGPASYFPSIEKKYGKPIEHWMKELKKVSKLAHMEQVAHLKEKFEMGHGHGDIYVYIVQRGMHNSASCAAGPMPASSSSLGETRLPAERITSPLVRACRISPPCR
jgi:hypothetical protein